MDRLEVAKCDLKMGWSPDVAVWIYGAGCGYAILGFNNGQAIKVNISIMRVFVQVPKWAVDHADLLEEIEALQRAETMQNEHMAQIYRIIDELVKPRLAQREPIGFRRK